MRPPSSIAKRYANALFRTAQRENVVDAVSADLAVMSRVFTENPQVLQAMAVPRVPRDRKKAALQAIVGEQLAQPVTRRFLDLTIDHGREGYLPETARAFALMADESSGIVNADVRSATALDEGQEARLKTRLDALTGLNTRISVSTDPGLVGGLIVRIGDTVLDGSVKGYLEQIGKRLLATTMPAVEVGAG